MLLFKKKFIEAILQGSKTQTIRLWTHARMKPGQRSYIPGVGYIRIESVELVTLAGLTDADARPDGFETADALRAEIAAIYSQYKDLGQQPYRIRFSLAPDEVKRQATFKKPVPQRKPMPPSPPQRRAAPMQPQPVAAPSSPKLSARRTPLLAEGYPLFKGGTTE
jgi:hypothetical protein